jgi:GH15 family glucan-1,4-alpha-glucosidase
MDGGFVKRYRSAAAPEVDGFHQARRFLPCTFWLCDNYAVSGRMDDARALFMRLLALRNDVGLLAEDTIP